MFSGRYNKGHLTENTSKGLCTKRNHLACFLPNRFVRICFFPDSEKYRLTEAIIPSPRRKFCLADHARFDPMEMLHFASSQPLVPTASANCRKVKKWAFFNPNFVYSEKRVRRRFSPRGKEKVEVFTFGLP
jgi:hypothetical protein